MLLDLPTWAEHYLRSRDAFEQQLVSLERTATGLLATYKKKTVTVVTQDVLGALPENKGPVLLVTAQTDENFKTLVKEFSTYAANQELTMLFVNPKLNEKWSIKPAVHASVADKESLKAGLTTMFQVVPTI
jgi:hypothetical protein